MSVDILHNEIEQLSDFERVSKEVCIIFPFILHVASSFILIDLQLIIHKNKKQARLNSYGMCFHLAFISTILHVYKWLPPWSRVPVSFLSIKTLILISQFHYCVVFRSFKGEECDMEQSSKSVYQFSPLGGTRLEI